MRECKECGTPFVADHPQRVYCKEECKFKYQNRKYGKIRRDKLRNKLQAVKMELGCAVCGYNKHPAALHFDHLNPSTKSFSLGNNNYPISKLEAELDKCQVLCANCHAEKTWENNHE